MGYSSVLSWEKVNGQSRTKWAEVCIRGGERWFIPSQQSRGARCVFGTLGGFLPEQLELDGCWLLRTKARRKGRAASANSEGALSLSKQPAFRRRPSCILERPPTMQLRPFMQQAKPWYPRTHPCEDFIDAFRHGDEGPFLGRKHSRRTSGTHDPFSMQLIWCPSSLRFRWDLDTRTPTQDAVSNQSVRKPSAPNNIVSLMSLAIFSVHICVLRVGDGSDR